METCGHCGGNVFPKREGGSSCLQCGREPAASRPQAPPSDLAERAKRYDPWKSPRPCLRCGDEIVEPPKRVCPTCVREAIKKNSDVSSKKRARTMSDKRVEYLAETPCNVCGRPLIETRPIMPAGGRYPTQCAGRRCGNKVQVDRREYLKTTGCRNCGVIFAKLKDSKRRFKRGPLPVFCEHSCRQAYQRKTAIAEGVLRKRK